MSGTVGAEPLGFGAPLVRYSALASLSHGGAELLHALASHRRSVRARTELVAERSRLEKIIVILSGWACRQRLLADGRRQIVSLLLPGDIVCLGQHVHRSSSCSIVTLTSAEIAEASPAELGGSEGDGSGLAAACEISMALDEAYLSNQIVRLGRQTAYERIAHLFLELRDRLRLAGYCEDDSFGLPLTQEHLADTLGLTGVHINRTLQLLRREGMIDFSGGRLTLKRPRDLAVVADYHPTTPPQPS